MARLPRLRLLPLRFLNRQRNRQRNRLPFSLQRRRSR
jgi:hypothetical protein